MSSDGANGLKPTTTQNDELTRQLTVQLSPEQYERLFFQPHAAKGDLAKRLGNPTLLGVLGFLVPFSGTMFCLLEFQGASAASLVAISGSWYFFGGIAMTIASICEFILGNTFPFVVFMIYGVHWVNIAYSSDPAHPFVAAYGAHGATSLAYNAGNGFYNLVMAMVSFLFLIGSLRTNVPFVIVFFCLVFLFGLFSAADFKIGHDPTEAGIAHAVYLLQIGGGFGFVAVVVSWYLCIILVCATTGVPCPLPIFDLSSKVFNKNSDQIGEHAGASAMSA